MKTPSPTHKPSPSRMPVDRILLGFTGSVALFAALILTPSTSLGSQRKPIKPAPTPVIAPTAPIPNCADLSDFIRSGGAIPLRVPGNQITTIMKGGDFRHEQPAAGDHPYIPTHNDYTQQWIFVGEQPGVRLLTRVHLHAHRSTYVRMECQDGQLLLEGELDNCDLYPQGMEVDTIGRMGDRCVPHRAWKIREPNGNIGLYEFALESANLEFGGSLKRIEQN